MRSAAPAAPTLAIMNNGGIRADLPSGPVTWGMVYQVQPFQNRLQRLTVKGSVLAGGARAVRRRATPIACPIVISPASRSWYDARKPAGKRIERTRFDESARTSRRTAPTRWWSATSWRRAVPGFGMLDLSPARGYRRRRCRRPDPLPRCAAPAGGSADRVPRFHPDRSLMRGFHQRQGSRCPRGARVRDAVARRRTTGSPAARQRRLCDRCRRAADRRRRCGRAKPGRCSASS